MKTIQVKQKYINKSLKTKHWNGESCPIALAIKDQVKCDCVSVNDEEIVVDGHSIWNLSRSVSRFVRKHDDQRENGKRLTVKPFNFRLDCV